MGMLTLTSEMGLDYSSHVTVQRGAGAGGPLVSERVLSRVQGHHTSFDLGPSQSLNPVLSQEMATHSRILPGESQGRGSLVGCRPWGRTESDTTEAT